MPFHGTIVPGAGDREFDTLTTLAGFNGTTPIGAPTAGLVQVNGSFYGTTSDGGANGYPVNKADLAHLSPYITRHIKRFGDYTIHTELAAGPIHHELSLTGKGHGRAVQQALPFAVEA